MVRIKLNLDESTLNEFKEIVKGFSGGLTEEHFPNIAAALNTAASKSASTLSGWITGQNGIQGLPAFNSLDKQNSALKMLQSIHVRKNAEFERTVIADSPELAKLQQGEKTKDFDMKTKYPYGNKSRISKKTRIPYLIIPFRWGTPNKHNERRAHFNNFIPQQDYQTNVKGMELSFVKKRFRFAPNAKGEDIKRAVYSWGSRIKDGEVDSPVSKFSGLHYSAGMVRMASNTGSTYFTFRIITPFQRKDMWIRKGKDIPGIPIEKAWSDSVRDAITHTLSDGINADLGE